MDKKRKMPQKKRMRKATTGKATCNEGEKQKVTVQEG
jgi:hypothetical protein